MTGSRRPARIGEGLECSPAFALLVVADREVSRDQEHLFPIIVHERLGGEDPGRDAQQPRAAAAFVFLVERPREDLLPDSRRIAGGNLPPAFQIQRVEFVMSLVHGHGDLPNSLDRSTQAPVPRIAAPL